MLYKFVAICSTTSVKKIIENLENPIKMVYP